MLSWLADEGPVRASAMVEKFGIDKGAVSRQLQHLDDLGLVERTPDPADGRATLVVASEDAVRRLADVDRAPPQVARRAARRLDRRGDSSDFAATLGRYNALAQRLTVHGSQTAVSAGSSRPSSSPLAITHVTGRQLDRVAPALSTTVSSPRREGEQVGARVEELDVLGGVARVLAPGGQRGPVERQRRVRVAAPGPRPERSAQSSGWGSQGWPVPGPKPYGGASPDHGIGTRQPSRQSRWVRSQAGSWRCSGGDVDVLEAELLALVEVRRPGQRQHRQRRRAGPGEADRARRRTASRAGRRRGC